MRLVIVIGHGIRAAGADPAPLLELGEPVLSSWQAADLVDNWHPNYFGRPGIYGQRCANRILYEADAILSIGCRLTPWMIGHAGLRPEQALYMVDVDEHELARFNGAEHIQQNVEEYMASRWAFESSKKWLDQCRAWREQYPWIESPAHDDSNGYINSYRFIQRLEPLLRPDEVVITDVGSLMCPVFQALHVRPPQRIMTSGGLGEMGCGLPAAVGATMAGAQHVICMLGDGGAMMNLQELQTIVHHRLPVKIIVFANDGYAMIKGTHRNIGIPYTGVSKASGVSMPRFQQLAFAFGMQSGHIRTWEDFDSAMPQFLAHDGPALLEVFIDPEQVYAPRLQPIRNPDGTFSPARFCDLSPQK